MSEAKRVLIIDDDPDFVTAIGTLLESNGYEAQRAVNGREGLKLAKMIRPDLILLDVMMTERTEGFFALQELRRIPFLKKTPIIVISSIYTEETVFRVSPEAGWLPADLYMPKPVDPARLLEEVRRLSGPAEAHVVQSSAGGREQ